MLSKGEKTREKITRTAAGLFRRRGFAGTSINDLIEATGIKKGSLYFHFPGKEDIALAVLDRAEEQFMTFLDAALTGPTPGARLDRFFQCALEVHRRDGFVGGCLFGNTALEASGGNEMYAARVKRIFTRWIEKIRSVIAEAQSEGEIRSDLPPDVLAQFVVSSMEGGIMLARLRRDEEPLSRCIETLLILLDIQNSERK